MINFNDSANSMFDDDDDDDCGDDNNKDDHDRQIEANLNNVGYFEESHHFLLTTIITHSFPSIIA